MRSTARPSQGRLADAVLAVSHGGQTTRLPLNSGRQTVGGSVDCDLVILRAKPEAAFHLDLTRRRAGQIIQLEAIRDDIGVNGKILKKGQCLTLQRGQEITFDDAVCRLEGRVISGNGLAGKKKAAAVLFGLAALLLIWAVQGNDVPSEQTSGLRLTTSEEWTVGPEATAKEIREALRLAGLSVDVTLASNGSEIRIGANTPKLQGGDKERLSAILAAFSHRGAVTLNDMTEVSSGVEEMIAAVVLEPSRFVIGKDGMQYHQGEIIGDGWEIALITDGHLIAQRGDDSDDISYKPASPGSLELRLATIKEIAQR